MDTKKIMGILLLSMFCVVCFRGHTQEVVPTKFNIFVSIQCSDITTKALVESYITRELRNLGDVTVNSQNILYTHAMLISVYEPQRLGIGKTGSIIISTVYIEYIDPFLELEPVLGNYLRDHLSLEIRQSIVRDLLDTKPITAYRQAFLTFGEKTSLPVFCRDTVAAFDITALQVTRKRR